MRKKQFMVLQSFLSVIFDPSKTCVMDFTAWAWEQFDDKPLTINTHSLLYPQMQVKTVLCTA